MNRKRDDRWRYASHAGARVAMLERNLTLTVRERLEEMQALNRLGERFAQIRASRATDQRPR